MSVYEVQDTDLYVYSYDMAAEKQTQGLRLAFLAASLLTDCMPMEFLFVHVYICICLFARHQPELLAPLPSLEIRREKHCHNALPSALHHLCFNTQICTRMHTHI